MAGPRGSLTFRGRLPTEVLVRVDEVVRWLQLGAFASLAVAAVVVWRRRRTQAAAWLAATFVVLGSAVALGIILPETRDRSPVDGALVKVVVAALALFPYCLFRFGTSFSRRLRRRTRLATLVASAMLGAILALPGFPGRGETVPAWYLLFTIAFVVYWTSLSLVAAACLWNAGRGQRAVARRRMRTLALASLALNCALLLLATRSDSPSLVLLRQGFGLASAGLFMLGFVPPRALRTIWRRDEMEQLRLAEAELMVADTTAAVAAVVLPQATQLVGARGAILVGAGCEAIAWHGIDEAAAGDLADLLEALMHAKGVRPFQTIDLVAIPLTAGWLAVVTSDTSPFFGRDELGILESLGHLTGLALDRAELFERDQASRAALAEREAQLAEAQQTALLGSYSWDVATGEVTWSAELYRILGFVPGEVHDFAAAFASRIHRDDQQFVDEMRQASLRSSEPASIEYRIVTPDSAVRWVHARVQPHCDAHGQLVRLTGTIQDITDRRNAEETMAFQARHDALTRLPNRTLFLDRLRHSLSARSQRPTGLAVLFLDVDRFKWLNDSLGHAAGDELLVSVASRLRAAVRPGDTVARFGGDEFVVLCEDVVSQDAAEAMADRLAALLGMPMVVRGEDTVISMSMGIAYSPPTAVADTPETLLRDADAAMYRAKELGRDRRETFTPATRQLALARHETATALHRGIDRGELVVHYQPEIDITTGDVVAVEALVRWMHPERGLLGPGEFIPLAEESGLIVRLGARVLHDACQQAAAWQPADEQGSPIAVSVNLAARQLLSPELCDTVRSALSSSGLDPSLLCVEITESVLLEDAVTTARALDALKALGVRIAVDDFGTGFSSLTYLKRFPVDILKIDRSFVEGVGVDREDSAIVASVVDLAHAFGLTTIAEGVETAEQLSELRHIGCEQGQGYLWSKPLPAEDAGRWIAARAAEAAEAAAALPQPPPGAGPAGVRRVLIVEDDSSLRRFLRTLFDGCDGYTVVGEADDGREAIALARHFAPDIVLLDLAMPGMGGLEALPLISAVAPLAKVVVLSGLEASDMAGVAVRRGAAAYFTKGRDPNELLNLLDPLVAAR